MLRCREIYSLGSAAIDCLLLLDGVEVPEELRELSGDVVYVSATVMKKISGMRSVDSTEAIAVMHMPKHFCDLKGDEGGAGLDGLFQSPKRILVLDGIQVSRISPLFKSIAIIFLCRIRHIVKTMKWFISNHRHGFNFCNASDSSLDSATWQDPGNLGTLIRSACAFKWVRNFLLQL